jgi:hypothetical protein
MFRRFSNRLARTDMDLEKLKIFIFIFIIIEKCTRIFLLHTMKIFIYWYQYLIGIGDVRVVQASVQYAELVRLPFNKIILVTGSF